MPDCESSIQMLLNASLPPSLVFDLIYYRRITNNEGEKTTLSFIMKETDKLCLKETAKFYTGGFQNILRLQS